MIDLEIGKRLDRQILDEFKYIEDGSIIDAIFSDGLALFLILKNVNEKELELFNGGLSVIFQDFEVPFLILDYKQIMTFSTPLRYKGELKRDFLTVFVVEQNGYIVKSIKQMKMKPKLMNLIRETVEKSTKLNIVTHCAKVHEIYERLNNKAITKNGVKQNFN